jgi:hypothetical protein
MRGWQPRDLPEYFEWFFSGITVYGVIGLFVALVLYLDGETGAEFKIAVAVGVGLVIYGEFMVRWNRRHRQ